MHKYLSGDNLIEDDGVADGLVRQHDAEAAVKEAENKRKDVLDLMVTLAKDTNATKTILSSETGDGFIIKTIIRKKGDVAYDEFSDDQLDFIRNTMFDMIKQSPEASSNEDRLAVINVCQEILECSPFDSVAELLSCQSMNDSEEEEDDDEEDEEEEEED